MQSAVCETVRPALASGSRQRIPALDGLRGVASLIVLCYHLFPHIAHTVPGSFLARLQRVLSLGWSEVDLFFVCLVF